MPADHPVISADQRREIVVGEDYLRCLLRDLRAAAHGDSDVSLLESSGVIDGVAGHGDYLSSILHQFGES